MQRSTAIVIAVLATMCWQNPVHAQTILRCAPFTSDMLAVPEAPEYAHDLKRFEEIKVEVKTRPHRVLFLGDSLTERFDPQVWREHMMPRGVLNAGVNGDRTEHLVWRLQHGQLDGPPPAAVVVLIGANDLVNDRAPEIVAEGIRADLLYLRQHLPAARIGLLGLWPRGMSPDGPLRRAVAAVNRLIRTCGDDRAVFYADIGGLLLDPEGRLNLAISPDQLHFSALGYARLMPRLDALIDRLTSAETASLVPVAPAPVIKRQPPGAEAIQMEFQGDGIYTVPVQINGMITLPFVIDSGASEVTIPADVFLTLTRTRTVGDSDFVGTGTYVLADGTEQSSKRFILHELRVGAHVIRDVVANVAPVKGDPLLGQSFLGKLPAWTIDNERHALVFHDKAGETREGQAAISVPTPVPAVHGPWEKYAPPQGRAPAPTALAPPALPDASLFDRFPAGEVYRGVLAMPDFEGRDREFKDFRTRIRNGIREGTNFASRYKVIQFGCGTGCSFVVVADVSTGRVYSFPHGGEYDQMLQLEYRVSSNLVRARWVPNLGNMDRCLQEDFLLKDGHFVSLGKSGLAACHVGYCDNGVCK